MPASGDPRPPLSARYDDADDYREQCLDAARDLVARGYLLERDIERVGKRAVDMYNWAMLR
jgi:hypothetical protein